LLVFIGFLPALTAYALISSHFEHYKMTAHLVSSLSESKVEAATIIRNASNRLIYKDKAFALSKIYY